MLSSTDLVLRFAKLLDDLHIDYMLVGSFSSNFYGRPRSTQDADFVVVIDDQKVSKLRDLLGSEFVFDPQMSFETVTMTMRYIVTHPETAFKIELFLLTDDPHNQSRFSRRQRLSFEGHQICFPTVEDVIIQKLRWRRRKDVDDARTVIAVKRDELDHAYIRKWTDQHGTTALFESLISDTV